MHGAPSRARRGQHGSKNGVENGGKQCMSCATRVCGACGGTMCEKWCNVAFEVAVRSIRCLRGSRTLCIRRYPIAQSLSPSLACTPRTQAQAQVRHSRSAVAAQSQHSRSTVAAQSPSLARTPGEWDTPSECGHQPTSIQHAPALSTAQHTAHGTRHTAHGTITAQSQHSTAQSQHGTAHSTQHTAHGTRHAARGARWMAHWS